MIFYSFFVQNLLSSSNFDELLMSFPLDFLYSCFFDAWISNGFVFCPKKVILVKFNWQKNWPLSYEFRKEIANCIFFCLHDIGWINGDFELNVFKWFLRRIGFLLENEDGAWRIEFDEVPKVRGWRLLSWNGFCKWISFLLRLAESLLLEFREVS